MVGEGEGDRWWMLHVAGVIVFPPFSQLSFRYFYQKGYRHIMIAAISSAISPLSTAHPISHFRRAAAGADPTHHRHR
jgi:hypothetical protein